MPMIVAVPPTARQPNACSAATFSPIASKEYCTPPPVISRIAATGSCDDASTICVAPSSRAFASLLSTISTAMIIPAPPMRAPWIAASPTPPAPNTATEDPGSIFAVFSTAPTPVITPQPTSAARSSGTSSRIFTTAFSCSSIFSAYAPRFSP